MLTVTSDPPAETLSFDGHSRFASGYGTERVFFSYFRCGNCSALYCREFYTQNQLTKLYGRQAENMGDVPLAARLRTQRNYAKLLMKYSRGGGGFLEIGPDIGLFAEHCATLGKFNQFWLYEPNETVHTELAARFRAYEYTIRTDMCPNKELPSETISTGALIHVLDHLIDPAAFLNEIRNKLEKDGVLLIITHNIQSLLARLLGRRFPPFALQHPQLYSPQSATTLLNRSGFNVETITAAVNFFPLPHLLRAGLAVAGVPNIVPNIQNPIIPVKLGNMALVARKRG